MGQPQHISQQPIHQGGPILLEETIEGALGTTSKTGLPRQLTSNVFLATTSDEMREAFRVRDGVYSRNGYSAEFESPIPGIEFDKYDRRSIHLLYCPDGEVRGTVRIICDPDRTTDLPSIPKLDGQTRTNLFAYSDLSFGEISRFALEEDFRATKTPLEMFAGVNAAAYRSGIDRFFMSTTRDHFDKFYGKFGGTVLIHEDRGFGELPVDYATALWNAHPTRTSKFERRMIIPHLRPELREAYSPRLDIEDEVRAA